MTTALLWRSHLATRAPPLRFVRALHRFERFDTDSADLLRSRTPPRPSTSFPAPSESAYCLPPRPAIQGLQPHRTRLAITLRFRFSLPMRERPVRGAAAGIASGRLRRCPASVGLAKRGPRPRAERPPRAPASAEVPTISRFFGVVIAMYFDDHGPPHFHARHPPGAIR